MIQTATPSIKLKEYSASGCSLSLPWLWHLFTCLYSRIFAVTPEWEVSIPLLLPDIAPHQHKFMSDASLRNKIWDGGNECGCQVWFICVPSLSLCNVWSVPEKCWLSMHVNWNYGCHEEKEWLFVLIRSLMLGCYFIYVGMLNCLAYVML